MASRSARLLGALAGLAAAVTLLAAARMPSHPGRLGLDLTAAALPSGELGLLSPGPLLAATGMEPGARPVGGVARVRNQTGRRLAFRLRALPSARDLDRVLRVRVAGDGHVLYEGALGGLRDWTDRGLVLRSGQVGAVMVSVHLPRGPAARSAGRVLDVPLEWRAERPS